MDDTSPVLALGRFSPHFRDDQRNPQRRFVREQPVRRPRRVRRAPHRDRRSRSRSSASPCHARRRAAAPVRRRPRRLRRSTGRPAYSVSNGAGGRYGACGSNTCTHANHGFGTPAPPAPSARPARAAIHSRASGTTADAGRSGMLNSLWPVRFAEVIVVGVETRVQTETRMQRIGGDERAGRIASGPEHRRRGARRRPASR